MLTIRQTIYVALAQLLLVALGLLSAGLIDFVLLRAPVDAPVSTTLLWSHPLMFLLVPPIWIGFALLIRTRPGLSSDTRRSVLWLGILLILGLVFYVSYASIVPWLSISWGLSADDLGI